MTTQILKLFGDVITPEYATDGSAGFDLRVHNFKKISRTYTSNNVFTVLQQLYDLNPQVTEIELRPGCRVLIGTGLALKVKREGWLPDLVPEIQIRPRSGLALKNGITVLNTPGTIDNDYVIEIGVIAINHGVQSFLIKKGDRIAQAVTTLVFKSKFEEVTSFDTTTRDGGFGSTGV